MDMSSSPSSDEATEQRPGRPRKRKLVDEDEQGNKKLKEGTEGEEPKKKMCRPKEEKNNGISPTKPSSTKIAMDPLQHNEIVLSTLKVGDMLEIPGKSFAHWVVYIGDGNVVHLTAVDASTSNVSTDFCVQQDNYRDVAGTSKLKINNSKDTRYMAFPGTVIKERALSMVGRTYFNIVLYNCEHFASWCRYGKAVSDQVYATMTMVGGCCAAGVVTNMILTDRAYMSFKNGLQYMCIALSSNGSMSNGTSCIDASVWNNIMNNGTSYIGALVCPFLLPEVKKRAFSEIGHSTLLSNCTHFADWYRNVTNLSEQALPWVLALGVCGVVGKLAHVALTRGKDKKSQKQ